MSKTIRPVEILRPYVRNGSFPIDSTTVFYSYEEATEYAHNNPSAYATQIIGVDDQKNKVTALYQLSYDPNKQYNYILTDVSIGSGGSFFHFKGSVETVEDLPDSEETLVLNGDMYLVETPVPTMYVAFIDSKGNVTWKPLSLNVSLTKVTKSNDGLMGKELYSSMFNESGKDAVYFSKADGFPNPDNNSWLIVEHTEKEDENGYTLASVGKTKEIIGNLMKTTSPHIEVEVINDTQIENPANSEIKPELRVYYYPELGGDIDEVSIYRRIKGQLQSTPAYEGHPEIYTNADGILYFDWEENEIQTAQEDSSVDYVITVSYLPSEDGNVTAGFCTNEISFYFYQMIYYGTNIHDYTEFLKNEVEISLKYLPIENNIKTNKFYIKVPKSANLYQVLYVPQNDYNALNLFQIVSQSNYIEYSYELGENTELSSSGEFKFFVKKNN